jgi:hypothetical protein
MANELQIGHFYTHMAGMKIYRAMGEVSFLITQR